MSNFSEEDYKAHRQNWSITQSDENWLYLGNTDGLVVYNGVDWARYNSPDKSTVRSVVAVGDRIYSGGYEDFGYWKKNKCGEHVYTSLKHLVSGKALKGEEIWHIKAFGKSIFFQSFAMVFEYDGSKVTKLDLPGPVMFMQILNKEAWIPVIGGGIYKYSTGKFGLVPATSQLKKEIVTGMVSCGNEENNCILIATSKGGLFLLKNGELSPWRNNLNSELKENQINKVEKLNTGEILIGTIRSGLYILNEDFTLRYHLNVLNGLQNNTVLGLYPDSSGNIWLALDKGVSCIHFKDNVEMYKDRTGTLGAVYTVAKLKENIFLGTNQGLYINENKNRDSEFKLVPGTQGQVWQLLTLGESLLCGHNEGTFLYTSGKLTKISEITGGWFTVPVHEREDLMIQGTYTGLALYGVRNDDVKLIGKIEGFTLPVKKIVQTSDNIFWVTAPNQGIIKLELDNNYRRVNKIIQYSGQSNLGYSHNYEIHLFKKKLCVSSGSDHFVFNDKEDQFEKIEQYTGIEGNFHLRSIHDSLGVKIFNDEVHIEKQNGSLYRYRLLANKDYHNVFTFNNKDVGICTNDGFFIFDLNMVNESKTENNIKFYKGIFKSSDKCFDIDQNKEIKTSYQDRVIKLFFATNNHQSDKIIKYMIEPGQKEWTRLQNGYIEFNPAAYGEYEVIVTEGNAEAKLGIEVSVPLYLKWWAFLIYGFVFILIIRISKGIIKKQIDRQAFRLKEENERLLREKMVQIENESLQKENIRKSKDLANVTKRLVQKNELLMDIKKEIMEMRKSGEDKMASKDYELFIRQINENLTLETDKILFNTNFEEVHESFIKRLKSDFPTLTGDDLQLAAYLRMNLSSKEIAPLFNISIRGLENKRYRLRKKMNLSFETDLNDFFINYDKM